jgi:hypothetical protein
MARDLFHLARLARKSLVYQLRTWLEDLNAQPHPGKIAHAVLFLQKALRVSRNHLRRLSGSPA